MVRPIDTLTALDEAEAEEAAGISIMALQDENGPKARIFAALAWAARKKAGEDVGKFTTYAETARTTANLNYLFTDPDAADDDADGEDDDPAERFPEGSSEVGAGADAGGSADAEGPVLSGDGDQS